ncbi:hypothetical protein EON65_58480 [archaeon]|nr:MAG: hypothetical protein EON65_58480 [archaeon]
MHRYYRYTTDDLLKYSPGLDVVLRDVDPSKREHNSLVFCTHLQYDCNNKTGFHDKASIWQMLTDSRGKFQGADLVHNRDVLRRTSSKPPFFGCFGLHEWAMLYSGRRVEGSSSISRHQEKLALRVTQQTIDDLVEKGGLKCTHFDAWRFFHPATKAWNMIPSMSRTNQRVYEQPGCVHSNMDLFKYAFQLYPFLSSSLLRASLSLALHARHIDMRASPYDVSLYVSGDPLEVETEEGRMQYVKEQGELYERGKGVRREILELYEDLLCNVF